MNRIRKEKWATRPVPMRHVYGFDICLNERDVMGVSPIIGLTGRYELHVTELYRKLLRKRMTVLDVGANIGWYTLAAGAAVGPEGRVLAFEPEPSNLSLLEKSIQLNSFENINVFPQALSDREGSETLHLSKNNLGAHSISSVVGPESITVPSTTLDKVLEKLGIDKIDILKVDVEGAEPQVIVGGEESLKNTEHILIEWNPSAWKDRSELIDMLLDNFLVYEIVRSPFLIKKKARDSLSNLPRTNLYLHRKSPNR